MKSIKANPLSVETKEMFLATVQGRRKFFDWLSTQYGIRTYNDWYKLNKDHIKNKGGAKMLVKYHHNSTTSALEAVYPEFEWFHRLSKDMVPSGFWTDKKTHRRWLDWVSEQLGIRDMEDWYNVKSELQTKEGANVFLHCYGRSLTKALMSIYPEYPWQPWRFSRVPVGFWDEENQKKYIEWLEEQLNVKQKEDWYKVRLQDATKVGGSGFWAKFSGSMCKALSTLYPDYKWLPWTFTGVPKEFWQDISNQRQFADWVSQELGLKKMEDWYNVKAKDVTDRGGSSFLDQHEQSLPKALAAVYPDFRWQFWKFLNTPRSHFKDPKNLRQYFDWLGDQLGVKEPEDWYKVRLCDAVGLECSSILYTQFGGSISEAVRTVYSEYPWKFWKFLVVPHELFEVEENQREYFMWLKQHFQIENPKDWIRVTAHEVRNLKGGSLILDRFGGFNNFLKKFTAEEVQLGSESKNLPQSFLLAVGHSKTEIQLVRVAKELFPEVEVLLNHRYHNFSYSNSNMLMELDIYIPTLSLAFELQGLQHYESTNLFGQTEDFQKRDEEKRKMCNKEGITLVEVPYWWDKTKSSLMATLHFIRPDLVPEPGDGVPIPNCPPKRKSNSSNYSQIDRTLLLE